MRDNYRKLLPKKIQLMNRYHYALGITQTVKFDGTEQLDIWTSGTRTHCRIYDLNGRSIAFGTLTDCWAIMCAICNTLYIVYYASLHKNHPELYPTIDFEDESK